MDVQAECVVWTPRICSDCAAKGLPQQPSLLCFWGVHDEHPGEMACSFHWSHAALWCVQMTCWLQSGNSTWAGSRQDSFHLSGTSQESCCVFFFSKEETNLNGNTTSWHLIIPLVQDVGKLEIPFGETIERGTGLVAPFSFVNSNSTQWFLPILALRLICLQWFSCVLLPTPVSLGHSWICDFLSHKSWPTVNHRVQCRVVLRCNCHLQKQHSNYPVFSHDYSRPVCDQICADPWSLIHTRLPMYHPCGHPLWSCTYHPCGLFSLCLCHPRCFHCQERDSLSQYQGQNSSGNQVLLKQREKNLKMRKERQKRRSTKYSHNHFWNELSIFFWRHIKQHHLPCFGCADITDPGVLLYSKMLEFFFQFHVEIATEFGYELHPNTSGEVMIVHCICISYQLLCFSHLLSEYFDVYGSDWAFGRDISLPVFSRFCHPIPESHCHFSLSEKFVFQVLKIYSNGNITAIPYTRRSHIGQSYSISCVLPCWATTERCSLWCSSLFHMWPVFWRDLSSIFGPGETPGK